jgi:hypothetical protein
VRDVTARRRLGAAALALVAVLALGTGACSSDDDPESTDDPTSTPSTPSTDADAELTSYDSIDDLHQQLVDEGIACGLEYSGLRDEGREVSICVIAGEQALLTIWDDPALVTEFADSEAADSGDVAYGANWTVDVDSPETADLVATALGGTVSD